MLLLGVVILGAHWYAWESVLRQSDSQLVREALLRQEMRQACGAETHSIVCEQSVRNNSLDRLRFTHYGELADQAAQAMGLGLSCILVGSALVQVGRWQPRAPHSEWEWLLQLPIASLPLLILRGLVLSLTPHLASLYIGPFFTVLAVIRGASWIYGVIQGYALLFILQAFMVTPRLLLDLWLRRTFTPIRRETLRVLIGLLGIFIFVLGFQGLSGHGTVFWNLIARYGAELRFTPPGLALESVLRTHGHQWFEACFWLLLTFLSGQLLCWYAADRSGLLSIVCLRQNESNAGPNKWSKLNFGSVLPKRLFNPLHRLLRTLGSILGPVRARELLLMRRNQHVMLQSLLLPWLVLAWPMLSVTQNPAIPLIDPPNLVVIGSFIAGILFLMQFASQLLTQEKDGLWMLLTYPTSVEKILQARLSCWIVLAAAYALIIFLSRSLELGHWNFEFGLRLLGVLWGLGVFAYIFMAQAVLAYNPGRQTQESQPSLSTVFIAFGLVLSYALALITSDVVSTLSLIGLISAFAWLFWRRAKRALPCLLDSGGAARSRFILAPALLIVIALLTCETSVQLISSALSMK